VVLGDMMQFPGINIPEDGGYLRNRMFQWRIMPVSPQPSLYSFVISEATTGNQWYVFVPGHITKFKLPYFPEDDLGSAVQKPQAGAFFYRMVTALIPGFNFGQWDLNESSAYNRRAWTQEVQVFTLDN